MEKNTDPRVIVLDRDVFDRLVGLARIGSFESGGSCDELVAHARRFNPHYASDVARERAAEEEVERQHRRAAKDLVSRKAGKEVYIRDTGQHFIPGVLKGIGRSKSTVRIEIGNVQNRSPGVKEVFIGNVTETIPSDLVLIGTGYWRGFYADSSFEGR